MLHAMCGVHGFVRYWPTILKIRYCEGPLLQRLGLEIWIGLVGFGLGLQLGVSRVRFRVTVSTARLVGLWLVGIGLGLVRLGLVDLHNSRPQSFWTVINIVKTTLHVYLLTDVLLSCFWIAVHICCLSLAVCAWNKVFRVSVCSARRASSRSCRQNSV